jgi:DNA polymerase III epsilon subunit-like protein
MIEKLSQEISFLRRFGDWLKFPDSYLVVDLETTGFSPHNDYIIDAGWAVVQNNTIVQQVGLLLDWRQVPNVSIDSIKKQLTKQEESYRQQGRPHYYPFERLCDEGENPIEVLHALGTLIHRYLHVDTSWIVGHAFWRFDRSFLDSHFNEYLSGYKMTWHPDGIFDTGLFEKAMQLDELPWPQDTLDSWLKRIDAIRAKGVKWSLEGHCVEKYEMLSRYNMDMSLMHTASFDCVLIGHLLDTFRQLGEIAAGKRYQLDNHILPGAEGSLAATPEDTHA